MRRQTRLIVVSVVACLGYLCSLYPAFGVVRDAVLGDRSGAVTSVLVINESFSAIGQTYRGHAGSMLAIIQIALVVAACVFVWSGRIRVRRAAVVVLVAWTLLWLGNALIGLALAPQSWIVWLHLVFVGPPAACSLAYCRWRWRRTEEPA